MKSIILSMYIIVGIFILSGCGGTSNSLPTSTTNSSPTVSAGADKSVLVNTIVTINGAGYDVDGNVTYAWRDSNNTLLATTASFDYNATTLGTYTFTLTVTDTSGLTASDSMQLNVVASLSNVNLSGKITYDLVPANANNIGLDYANITQETCKFVIVDLLDSAGNLIATTETNATGGYTFSNLVANTQVKVRVYAKMLRSGTPSWDVKVVDNTSSYATYVMDGALASVGSVDSVRNLNAPSGWGGSSYTTARVAAPFAVLDTVHSAMDTVLNADPLAIFSPLVVSWSKLNTNVSGDRTLGQITTSHYLAGELYILGDADNDTDEYDNHVIAHEWGHYYEDKFSRSDSIGGSHGNGDVLDIRVAFGEGWGNAFSAIALNNPIYYDTYGSQQSSGFTINMESGTTTNPGWFSETSVENIIYDLYDNAADNNDNLALGFGPIHNIFVNNEKNTTAFTSIFTFIDALKNANSANAAAIDSIVADENIATITDIYGTGRTNKTASYPYHDFNTSTGNVVVTTTTTYGIYNKLENRQYVKFNIGTTGSYTVQVSAINSTSADPDFVIYQSNPFSKVTLSDGSGTSEQVTLNLTIGSYLLDISDYNNTSTVDFNVTIN
ncbi:PKD domain-containing protein [Sulfurimonas sp.]